MSNLASPDYYRCHWCSTLNNAAALEWCLCATSQPTLVCAGCNRCFCTAPNEVRDAFWESASATLVANRWMAAHQSAPNRADARTLHRPVILVVDDTKVIHTVVDTILAGFSGSILHAYDGADALRIARAVIPEILLTDALLPGIDGRDVARLLKAHPATAAVRTIVMTALYKGSRYRNEAFRDFKVDAYIEKPVTARELRNVIEQMIDTKTRDQEPIAS